MDETVRFRARVHVDAEAEIETGLTVEQWNALTAEQRSVFASEAWEALVQQDDGGFTMLTDGAESL